MLSLLLLPLLLPLLVLPRSVYILALYCINWSLVSLNSGFSLYAFRPHTVYILASNCIHSSFNDTLDAFKLHNVYVQGSYYIQSVLLLYTWRLQTVYSPPTHSIFVLYASKPRAVYDQASYCVLAGLEMYTFKTCTVHIQASYSMHSGLWKTNGKSLNVLSNLCNNLKVQIK